VRPCTGGPLEPEERTKKQKHTAWKKLNLTNTHQSVGQSFASLLSCFPPSQLNALLEEKLKRNSYDRHTGNAAMSSATYTKFKKKSSGHQQRVLEMDKNVLERLPIEELN